MGRASPTNKPVTRENATASGTTNRERAFLAACGSATPPRGVEGSDRRWFISIPSLARVVRGQPTTSLARGRSFLHRKYYVRMSFVSRTAWQRGDIGQQRGGA